MRVCRRDDGSSGRGSIVKPAAVAYPTIEAFAADSQDATTCIRSCGRNNGGDTRKRICEALWDVGPRDRHSMMRRLDKVLAVEGQV